MGFAQNGLKIEQELSIKNNYDLHANPTDGLVEGVGLNVIFRSEEEINTPTGCTMLDVVKAAQIRLNFIQTYKVNGSIEITSKCQEYAVALNHINKALAALRKREERVLIDRAGGVGQ